MRRKLRARRCVRGGRERHSDERKMGLGKLLGGCAACCVFCALEERENWWVETWKGGARLAEGDGYGYSWVDGEVRSKRR